MSAVSSRGTPDDEVEVVDPRRADAAIAQSEMLVRLDGLCPWLSEQQVDGVEQRWIFTTKPPWVAASSDVPNPAAFSSAHVLDAEQTARRPLAAGLWTSSASDGYQGMWSTFLEQHATSELWGKPWRVWRMNSDPAARITQVTSAKDWAGLVDRYPLPGPRFVHPDWRAVAGDFDAVRFTPAAVCAIDGVSIEASAGRIAPTYVTVESTLWLRWRFTGAEQVAPLV
jgi:hypothetical protein